jgi:hypothetical protein
MTKKQEKMLIVVIKGMLIVVIKSLKILVILFEQQ